MMDENTMIPETAKEPIWTYSPGIGWVKDGLQMEAREEAEYIWASMPAKSRSGYKLDISDPTIGKYYRIYKERLGLPPHIPISDGERQEFELQYLTAVVQRRRQQHEQG